MSVIYEANWVSSAIPITFPKQGEVQGPKGMASQGEKMFVFEADLRY